jgi:hypothetical protein
MLENFVAKDLYPAVFAFLSSLGHKATCEAFLKDVGMKRKDLRSDDDLLAIYRKAKLFEEVLILKFLAQVDQTLKTLLGWRDERSFEKYSVNRTRKL